ncbi:MAG: nucleotidyltransferase family protein [Candidatus Krumholzibacteriia bacterium]
MIDPVTRRFSRVHTLAPEAAYLSELARAWASGAGGPVPSPSSLNPERFLRVFARQHAVQTLEPYLDPRLMDMADRIRLRQGVEVSRRRTVMMLLELERVLPALTELGCRPVVLKGASLALTVYPRPEDRWFVDLDLLVEPAQLPLVYDTLHRLGYRFAETAAAAELYEQYHFHRILVSGQGVCLEAHWALTLPSSVYSHDLEALRRSAVEIPLGNASFLAPGTVDQILHGVLQSIADGFNDLRRMLDLHLLDARLLDEEREVLCARARQANLSTGLWLQYHLRERILGAPSPGFLDYYCRPDPNLARTVDQLGVAEACLLQRAADDRGYANLLHWLCVPKHLRPREVRRYIFPGMEGLVNSGLCRHGPLPAWRRGRLALSRSLVAGRMLTEWARAAV